MNYEDDALGEVAAAVLSIEGPHIDLSNPDRLLEQTSPVEDYFNLPDEEFPLAIVYIDGEAYNQVANDRYEISLYFRITLAYKYKPGERKRDALLRGKKCLRQIYRRILERQSSGESSAWLYPTGNMADITAVNHDTNPDGNDYVCVASGQITFNQLETEDR